MASCPLITFSSRTYSIRRKVEERKSILKRLVLTYGKPEVLSFLKRKAKTLKSRDSLRRIDHDMVWIKRFKLPKNQDAYDSIQPESVYDDDDSSSSSSSSSDADSSSSSSSSSSDEEKDDD